MAVIRDVMAAFELFQPTSVADAQKLLEQHGPDAWVLAGGLDSFDWLKDRIRKPKVVVDLSGIEELRGVRTTADGIEIGAMTTLTEVVNHPVIKQNYELLAQGAELVAVSYTHLDVYKRQGWHWTFRTRRRRWVLAVSASRRLEADVLPF